MRERFRRSVNSLTSRGAPGGPKAFFLALPMLADESRAGSSRRPSSRHRWRVIAVVLVLTCLAVYFVPRWAEPRQSAVRMVKHSMLRSVAQAAEIYQQGFGSSPSIQDLLVAKLVVASVQREFSEAIPVDGASRPGDPWPLVVQTTPCRAVRRGEAWGGPGEAIDHDLPACRIMLMPDWTVRSVDEDVYQRDLARHLRLAPLK